MGSCIIHAHSGKTVYKLECQVTKTEGYFILGRDTAIKMNYINFPEVKPPQRSLHNLVSTQAVSQESTTVSVDKLTKKKTVPDKVTQPVKPTGKCNRDSITLNGKKHSLPTTKESDERIQRCIQWNRNSPRRTPLHSAERKLQGSTTCTLPSSN